MSFPESGGLAGHLNNRNNHFFQADSAMLKGIAVIIYIVIVIIRIAQKAVFFRKNKGGIDGGDRQSDFAWIPEGKHFFWLIMQIASVLVTKIGCGLLISDNLARSFDANASVIGC